MKICGKIFGQFLRAILINQSQNKDADEKIYENEFDF